MAEELQNCDQCGYAFESDALKLAYGQLLCPTCFDEFEASEEEEQDD